MCMPPIALLSRGSCAQDAMIEYGKQHNGMSEYEAYFSYVWLRHRERVTPAYVPWALRMPHLCSYRNSTMLSKVSLKPILLKPTSI